MKTYNRTRFKRVIKRTGLREPDNMTSENALKNIFIIAKIFEIRVDFAAIEPFLTSDYFCPNIF